MVPRTWAREQGPPIARRALRGGAFRSGPWVWQERPGWVCRHRRSLGFLAASPTSPILCSHQGGHPLQGLNYRG